VKDCRAQTFAWQQCHWFSLADSFVAASNAALLKRPWLSCPQLAPQGLLIDENRASGTLKTVRLAKIADCTMQPS
jgi:hypothetical protein